ncbi:MAG: 4Fe-4S binding protein [Rhodospirillaceae bacterium]
MGILRGLAAGLCAMLVLAVVSVAIAERLPPLPEIVSEIFPGADGIGQFSGNPAAALVSAGGRPVGYLLSTKDNLGSVGLSGKPLDVLVGVDLNARIAGVRLVEHHEPILVLGIEERRLTGFVRGHRGYDLRQPEKSPASLPDAISGATVSSLLLRHAIVSAARAVARSRGLLAYSGGATTADTTTVDLDSFQRLDWDALVAEGAVARLQLSGGEVTARLALDGGGVLPVPVAPDTRFIDLYAALVTPASIGRNLLGDREFGRLITGQVDLGQVVLIAANGLYSFKGTGFVRTGIFERVRIVQGERLFVLGNDRHSLVRQLADGMPEFREVGLFLLPADSGFDPAAPWRLELMVSGARADGGAALARLELPYRLPERLLRHPALEISDRPEDAVISPEDAVIGIDWRHEWSGHPATVLITLLALGCLTIVLCLQDWLSRRPLLFARLRIVFLLFTVAWFGWITQGQLSVTNIITLIHAVRSGFNLDMFLLLPVIFMLWLFVAAALVFWGRSVYCGWLCPFGAVQELIYAMARRLRFLTYRLPSYRVPTRWHRILGFVKYTLFLAVIGVSLLSIEFAIGLAELEPFKTITNLHFARAWPFVLYVVVLLAAGMVIERFFCRYLCMLGAGLALPAGGRIFDWLQRRPECGGPCRVCSNRCPVGAVRDDGLIDAMECIYCLKCQLNYNDARLCPPLAKPRLGRPAKPSRQQGP